MYVAAGGAPSPDVVTPGLLGFIVFALLGLALFLLVRSMNKHVRRVDVPGDRRKRDEPRRPGTPPDEQ
ncbi:MAG: hypothetical protein J2P24_04775 [Streptosporangiales bacterium]|nr:hypothetical protein [Streptosporangiales bacterium]